LTPLENAALLTPGSLNREFIPELAGLRGIAVLLVLWQHCGVSEFKAPRAIVAGSSGVELFFLLSGFLIYRILLYNRQQGIGIGSFWRTRIARIFPLAYAGLLLAGLVRWSDSIFYAATYTYNYAAIAGWANNVSPISHYWTLAVEEHFYLVVPFFALFLSRKYSWLPMIGLGILVPIFAYTTEYCLNSIGAPTKTIDLAISNGTTSRGWPLVVGASIACFESHVRNSRWLTGAVAAISITSGMLSVPNMIGAHWNCWFTGGMYSRQLVLIGLFLLVLWKPMRPNLGILRDQVMQHVGTISYGLYVLHWPIYDLLGVRITAPAGVTGGASAQLIAIVLTFLAAELSYRYYETPARRWISGAPKDSGKEAVLAFEPVVPISQSLSAKKCA
jgi:peptidoglycan/LPS O-acetylase OafA/YrhL